MTLSFSTHWPKTMPEHMAGKPNYFVDKVWKGILHPEVHPRSEMYSYQKEYSKKFSGDWGILPQAHPKIHTIRNDKNNRWKVGSKIHQVINNRTKNRFQFTPTLEVKGIQRIEIEWTDLGSLLGREARIYIDNIKCVGKYSEIDKYHYDFPGQSLQNLALNDGFDSVEDFFSWFNKDFTGKIIHWTNHRY